MTNELLEEDNAVCADYAARYETCELERYVLDFSECNVPEHMHGAIDRYINHRLHPGGFLEAVLCNDLTGAVSKADLVNRNHLADYVKWFYNHAPSGCWGSRENFERWLNG